MTHYLEGRFTSCGQQLEADIRTWIYEWNKNPKPFVWVKTADEILETLAAYCNRLTDS